MINSELADSFMQRYSDFLVFVYEEHIGAIQEDEKDEFLIILALAREIYDENRGIFDDFIEADGKTVAIIDDAIQSLDLSYWIYTKDTTKYSLFINIEEGYAYAVQGLTAPIKEMCGGTGVFLRTGIIMLDDYFVCDGIMQEIADRLDTSQKQKCNEVYKEIKQEKLFFKKPSQIEQLKVGSWGWC